MNAHKVLISQQLPDNSDIQEVTVDVLASCGDSALAMVFSWYDKATHILHERAVHPDREV
jgi:hypothetical protein